MPTVSSTQFSTAAFAAGWLYIIGGLAAHIGSTTDVYGFDMGPLIRQRGSSQSLSVWTKKFKVSGCMVRPPMLPGLWISRENMIFPKSNPQCVVVDSKIHVIGRKQEKVMTTPCIEVYSPKDDKWDLRYCDWPPFGKVEPIIGVLSDDNDTKHVLLQPSYGASHGTRLYTYNIANNTLLIQPKFQPFHLPIGRQHAVVDDILYCYRDEEEGQEGIVGYDLTGGEKWAQIPVFGLWPHLLFPLDDIHLVGIGKDLLCVLWMDDWLNKREIYCNREEMKGKSMLFIMTFKMSKLERNLATRQRRDPSIFLNASLVSSRCYMIPGDGPLLDCLVF